MNNMNQNLKAPEVLVLLLQNERNCLLESLMKICKPIVYSAIKNLYFEGFEKEDLLQEGRIVLIKAVDDYRFDKNLEFLNYYQMMLMNHLHKLLRKQEAQIRRANKNAYSLEELIETTGIHIQGLATVDTQPEDVTLIKEAYSQYLSCLSELEASVYAEYLDHKSLEDTAEILGLDVERVQNALYRCKRKLDNHLK